MFTSILRFVPINWLLVLLALVMVACLWQWRRSQRPAWCLVPFALTFVVATGLIVQSYPFFYELVFMRGSSHWWVGLARQGAGLVHLPTVILVAALMVCYLGADQAGQVCFSFSQRRKNVRRNSKLALTVDNGWADPGR